MAVARSWDAKVSSSRQKHGRRNKAQEGVCNAEDEPWTRQAGPSKLPSVDAGFGGKSSREQAETRYLFPDDVW